MNKLFSFGFLLLLSISSHADWTLANDQSSINFVSIKKSSIGEVHRFTSLSGTVKDGKATVSIDLSSVDTQIPIRNNRMKSMLFQVAKFPKATIKATIDEAKINTIKPGALKTIKVPFSVNLHGITKVISAEVQVLKLSNQHLVVRSSAPLIISASNFGLNAGVEALKKIAGLPSISTAVPVTFNLVFSK